jgi:ESS family glutamate:Na+ symporter
MVHIYLLRTTRVNDIQAFGGKTMHPPPVPFEPMLLFGSFAAMLLLGVLLRATIPLFQKFLMPSCLIGGITGLVLISLGALSFSSADIKTFAYHFFNLSFISVGLTGNGTATETNPGEKGYLKGPLWMALTQNAIFPMQAIVGGLLVIVFGLIGLKLFPTFGFFAPLGFEEGPGQALSFGKVWEEFGFSSATTIGLTFATVGFFFSFFVGVPLANWGIRKGFAAHGPKALPRDLLIGILAKNQKAEPAGRLSFHSGNVESLAFQTALVGLVYILTYTCIKYIGMIVSGDVASILWGFFFIFGLGIAILVRWAMGQFNIAHLADAGIQRRITGWSVDFLIVATVMAIELAVVWEYIVPISVTATIVGVMTTFVIVYLGKRIWSYNLERMVAIYGTVTGTASCGLLLLRIVDPEFKTPVAIDIALMNIFSIPGIGLCLVLVNGPVWWNWSTGLTILVFFGVMIVALALLKIFKLWGTAKF